MPIEIRHDPSSAMMALVSLLGGQGEFAGKELENLRAGGRQLAQASSQQYMQGRSLGAQQAMQAASLSAQRNAQIRQIAAQGEAQKQEQKSTMERMAFESDLQLQRMAAASPMELEQKRKEAEIERQNWEFQYDMQGKKRIAELNKARQYITQSGQFSPQEQTALLPLLDMQIANVPKAVIEKSEMTKQLEALGPEKQPGRLWKGDDGSSYQTIIGTSGLPEPKLMLRQDQTTEHHLAIAEAANQAKVVATQARYLDARRSAMITWTKEKVPVTKPAVGGGWFGYGAEEGGPTGEERLRTPEEVEALADRFFPLGQPQQPQEQRVTREAPGAPALRPPKWVADALSKGSIKLTEEERKSVEGAPREILEALVYIKAALDKWPNPKDMPPSVVQEMMAAQRLIDMLPQ